MKIAAMFRVLAGLILVQTALGALVTFGFVVPPVHIVWGTVVFATAVVVMLVGLASAVLSSVGLIAILQRSPKPPL